jgi:hypothetical protein
LRVLHIWSGARRTTMARKRRCFLTPRMKTKRFKMLSILGKSGLDDSLSIIYMM